MNLPFFKKREAPRKAVELGITCDRVVETIGSQDLLVNFQAVVIFDDGTQSPPLAGGLEFDRNELAQMLALVTPKNRKKRSQCKNGHPKTVENTVAYGSGHTICRICYLAQLERRNAERAAKGGQK